MSSGSTIIVLSAASSADGGSDGHDDECRTCCYGGVAVACVSLLLFCVLSATAGVVKACAVTVFTVVLVAIVGWLVPGAMATGRDDMGAARRATHHDEGARVVMALQRRAGYSYRPLGGAAAIDVPPAFAYECEFTADAESCGSKSGGSAQCGVCLEDVQRGQTVRRMPACGHLFHKECIDMWLHSHTTCPLCRCELSPLRHTSNIIVTTTVATQSAADTLPPV